MKDRAIFTGAFFSRWIRAQGKQLIELPKDKVVFAAFAASCAFLIASYIYPWVALRKIKLPEVKKAGTNEVKTAPQAEARPLEFYLKDIKADAMFGRSQGAKEAAASVNADLTKDMELVGIVSGENPQAIIQDAGTEKVYYLNKGQFIGDFQVEEIQEGKVILGYKGERIELHL